MTRDLKAEVLQTIRNARQGDRQTVLAALRKALSRDPDNVRALLTLAGLTRNADEAVAALARVRKLDPDNEMARRGLVKLRTRDQPPPQERHAQKPPVPVEPALDQAADTACIEGAALVYNEPQKLDHELRWIKLPSISVLAANYFYGTLKSPSEFLERRRVNSRT